MTIFLILTLVSVLSAANMVAPAVSYEYDELRLALQWPTSYCNTGTPRCDQIPPYLTVHGLWPNSYSPKLFRCPPPPPNASFKNLYRQVSTDVQTDLGNYWPNLKRRSPPDSLWKHEYETHGYCFTEFPNPEIYFRTALSIAKPILHDISLTPGLYPVQESRRVTIAGKEFIVGLRCNYAWQSEIPQLLEIVICMDSNKNLKDCTNYVYECDKKWRDSSTGVERNGLFAVPQAPASLTGSYRSTP